MALLRKVLRRKGKRQVGGAYDEFCKQYTMSDVILGSGTYAEVRKAFRKADNSVVAVKIIDKVGLSAKELDGLSKEVGILKKLRHKNVVRLYDWFEEEDTMYVVMEYVGGGELFTKIISEDRPFTENDARRIIRTLAEALKHCKERGVIHRDIKPQNLLLTTKELGEELKLADFNLSIQVEPDSVDFSLLETMCGTPNYVAPEILTMKPYDFKCDIWSLGVICYLLLSGGYLPFFVAEEGELGKDLLLKKVKAGKWGFHPSEAWAGVSDQAKDFLRNVMCRNPAKRYNYENILSHPWLKRSDDLGSVAIDVGMAKKMQFWRRLQTAHKTITAVKKFKSVMDKATAEDDDEFNS